MYLLLNLGIPAFLFFSVNFFFLRFLILFVLSLGLFVQEFVPNFPLRHLVHQGQSFRLFFVLGFYQILFFLSLSVSPFILFFHRHLFLRSASKIQAYLGSNFCHADMNWALALNQYTYLPTPPLGQDMTQGQFLSGVYQVWIQSFSSSRLVASPRLKNQVCPTIYP